MSVLKKVTGVLVGGRDEAPAPQDPPAAPEAGLDAGTTDAIRGANAARLLGLEK